MASDPHPAGGAPKAPSDATRGGPAASPRRGASTRPRLPEWFKVQLPGGERYAGLKEMLRGLKLHTVCEEAHCPNIGECWNGGTATIMVLGETCTRGCRFCAVTTGNPHGVLDPDEPGNTAVAVERMGFDYVVLTSVDRDDLPDFGADHYARCIEAIKTRTPHVRVEVLTPDFQGREGSIRRVVDAGPDVFAHNLETVRRLHRRVRDVRATYDQSLEVLRLAKAAGARFTKSAVMVGLGETRDEVVDCMRDMRQAGVELLTIGQYLRPSKKHVAVDRFWTPEEFQDLERAGEAMGFRYVAAAPLVRSSYRAGELFLKALLDREAPIPARPRRLPVVP